MGCHGSGRKPDMVKKIFESHQPIVTAESDPIVIPNRGGDHSAGTALKTPAKDTDIANKKYVDDTAGSPVTVTDTATINMTLVGQDIKADTIDSAIDHDSLLNFTANEHIAGSNFAVSGSATTTLGAHVSDSSDPHGALLTQADITSSGVVSGQKIVITADNDASGQSITRNVVIGTEASPGAASQFTQGSIYLQYTA